MPYQESNMSYLPGNQGNMMNIASNNAVKSLAEETKKQRALYPEIHYKLQPFIASTCDAIESSGVMPTQEELEDITDGIFDDFCKVNPEMADYMKANDRENDMPEAVQTQMFFGGGFRPGGFGRFRRRGLGRDLISSLLLAQLFGGRRPFNPYYPYYPFY